MMLLSGRIVEIFPGDRIIFALALAAIPSLCVAVLAAAKMSGTEIHHKLKGGGLTADPARLRLAIVGICAAALVQSSHAEVYSFATINWRKGASRPI